MKKLLIKVAIMSGLYSMFVLAFFGIFSLAKKEMPTIATAGIHTSINSIQAKVNKKNTLDFIVEGIKRIETSGYDTFAIGDEGRALGLFQIHKGCLDDVNTFYGTSFEYRDRFNAEISERICRYYLAMGIARYKKRNGKYPSEKRIVQMWNFGIYQQPTDNGYYKKYLRARKDVR